MSYKLPSNHRPAMKIILVGSSGVGKTCLISSFRKSSFDEHKTPTVAPSYSFVDVENSKGLSLRLQIWDTAGQERYTAVSQMFFRDADIAFVCFEAGDEVSFNAVPDWIKRVRDEVSNCDIFLVVTKIDIKTEDEIKDAESNARSQFASFEPKGIFVTSAKTYEGVQDLFMSAAELYKPKNAMSNAQPELNRATNQQTKKCC